MSGPLDGRLVAVIGFGNQGSAQAQNLRDSGVRVLGGARTDGSAAARAAALAFEVASIENAARRADVVAMLLPDEVTPRLWPSLLPALLPATHLVFAHGYVLLYGALAMPPGADVVLVSPTGPGRVLRESFVRGEGLPAYLAVHQDASSSAWDLAEAYAGALGSTRAPLWRTTVREETEVDLFGEQAVLCGGMNALVTAGFDTLVDAGYSPEIAYLEVVHQLRYLAELLHERGVAGMRESISGTARYGDVTRGPRVIGEASRQEMQRMLGEIQSGAFAREWDAETAAGQPRLRALVEHARRHRTETARAAALGVPNPPPDGDSRGPGGG